MKKLFPGYYHPSSDEIANLWSNGTFILDANVLLDLYRVSTQTQEKLLNVLDHFSERLWLPHQVVFEFFTHRISVILDQEEAYEKVNKRLSELVTLIEGYEGSHLFLQGDDLLKQLDKVKKQLQKQKKAHPNWLSDDPVLDKLDALFDSKIGKPFPNERLEEIYKDGEERYERLQPPGYMDKDKKDNRQFGDLIIWFQIIEYAENTKKPIIYITRDQKEDWWWKVKGKTIGPHKELVQEIHKKAGVHFYMYQRDQFLKYAQDTTGENINDAIEEVQKLQEYDEVALIEQELPNPFTTPNPDKVVSAWKPTITDPNLLSEQMASFIGHSALKTSALTGIQTPSAWPLSAPSFISLAEQMASITGQSALRANALTGIQIPSALKSNIIPPHPLADQMASIIGWNALENASRFTEQIASVSGANLFANSNPLSNLAGLGKPFVTSALGSQENDLAKGTDINKSNISPDDKLDNASKNEDK